MTNALASITGASSEEVLSLNVPTTLGETNGGTAVISSSNSFPGRTVFNSALKQLFVHSKSDNVTGSFRLLTIRRLLVSLVCPSAAELNTAMAGTTSIGRHTVPVNCNTILDWL